MHDVKITPELIEEHLTTEEYAKAVQILGREPNIVELGLFSAMWSEHCSYKSSRRHLRGFPVDGPQVIQGPGENAGVVDIGDGYAVVFKMESHNHPSFIEPYQGAATGVGGILRDVFTMGARPVANLDALWFGAPDHPRTRYLVDGVVAGIAGYGNCIGVPTVGGQLTFHKSYNGNCLVNAFNLGIVRADKIFLGRAEGRDNPVMYVGSKTGRDGIHGATMASAEFTDESEKKRPTVQVGDPFTEKLLLEACLELFKTDYVVGIQDMGAAGMTSSSFEMAGRTGAGVTIDLARVPRREEGMNPYEIMLSESQERMLLVCRQGVEEKVREIFHKWGLSAEVVGKVTDDGMVRLYDEGAEVAVVPAAPLSEEAPVYDRPHAEDPRMVEIRRFDPSDLPEPGDYAATLATLLASPNLCSREWVWRQYDHMVRTDTVELPGSDAGVVRVKETDKGVAMSVDCNSRYCFLDPYEGGKQAVAEATRNVAASGATPLAITDCLNFGNPERPEVMRQFVDAIRGMSEACLALNAPVVSGNVSFYNQTGDVAVNPTPSVGAVGLLPDVSKKVARYVAAVGERILLLGDTYAELGGSEYLAVIHGIERGVPPKVDLDKEARLQKLMVALADERLVVAMHDLSDGGLAVGLVECLFNHRSPFRPGFAVACDTALRTDHFLFSESQSRAIVAVSAEKEREALDRAAAAGVPATAIGSVTDGAIRIEVNGVVVVETDHGALRRPWEEALPRMMEV
jgi:phosphoribosylformylglycinamidine synthase